MAKRAQSEHDKLFFCYLSSFLGGFYKNRWFTGSNWWKPLGLNHFWLVKHTFKKKLRLLIGACNLCAILHMEGLQVHGRLVQYCTDTRRVGAILHTVSDPPGTWGLAQYCTQVDAILQYSFFPPLPVWWRWPLSAQTFCWSCLSSHCWYYFGFAVKILRQSRLRTVVSEASIRPLVSDADFPWLITPWHRHVWHLSKEPSLPTTMTIASWNSTILDNRKKQKLQNLRALCLQVGGWTRCRQNILRQAHQQQPPTQRHRWLWPRCLWSAIMTASMIQLLNSHPMPCHSSKRKT